MSVLDKVEVKINTKIDVPTETAEACVRLLEIWVNAEPNREIEADDVDIVDGGRYFRRIHLVEGE